MVFNISKQELNLLYDKAKASYYRCIENKDNAYLQEEVPILLTAIELKYWDVKIVFSQENTEHYEFEITLSLWNSAELMGKYSYTEDNKGNIVDGSLVFF